MKDLLSRIGQWTEKMWRSIPIHLRDAIFTALLLGIAAAICFVLRSIDENGSFTLLIFVLAVVIISRFTEGYFWGVFSSLFGVICVNFVFTYPFWAFNFRLTGYPLTFLTMLAVSLIISAMNTKIKKQERLRTEAERETMRANLLRAMSHDIRTPLTSIVGYLTLLAEAPDMPETQRARYAQVALDRSYRLEAMMEEFFEITRYNLSSIPIERQRFDAALLCRQVADEFYPSAQARSIDIEVRAEEPLECFADAEKVSRVLNNLLKNAVAYADGESTVVVSARREEALASDADGNGDAKSAALVVEVENQGREISPEHLQAIFEKFYREDGARSTQDGGAGLGLAIAREIARAHGGELTARSVEGRTTFTLRIPA